MTKEITLIDNIKKLYAGLDSKKAFVELVASEFMIRPTSVAVNWFSNYWAIPQGNQARVVELLQNAIKEQNQKKSA